MQKLKLYIVITILGVLTLIAGACEAVPITQAATGTLNVYVTDAKPGGEVTSIMVTVDKVEVHQASAEQEQEQH